MNIIIGLVIVFGCIIGSFMASGGHLNVLWQPYEFIVILGAGLGAFVAGYPLKVIKDAGKALSEAFSYKVPIERLGPVLNRRVEIVQYEIAL